MIKPIIFVLTLIACITTIVMAYSPYRESVRARKQAAMAVEKTTSLAPRLKNRITEIEKAIILTSGIQFKFDLTRYDAQNTRNVFFVWEDKIYKDHGGKPPRPIFAYEEHYQDMIAHFHQYEDLKRISRGLEAGITDSMVEKGKDALTYIDGLASRYLVIGRPLAFRYPDPRGRAGTNAHFEAQFFIVDTSPNLDEDKKLTGHRLDEPIFSEDKSMEVIAYGKTRIASPKPMATDPRYGKGSSETPEAHEARLNKAFLTQVKKAIREEIETLTNKTVSFDIAM